jgi:hypothetical protein
MFYFGTLQKKFSAEGSASGGVTQEFSGTGTINIEDT